MKGGDASGGNRAPRGNDDTWPTLEPMGEGEEAEVDLISLSQLMRKMDDSGRADIHRAPVEDVEDLEDTAPVPRITRMPEGIRVDERRVGRAVAQWILHVRCECGRRWFEVEAIDTTNCPRCGVLVYVDIDARGVRR
jgi:hypothetical protein